MRAKRSDDNGKDGVRKETFRHGKVSAVGRLVDGKKQGLWKYYFRNGA
jgi:antitoxin component YwqK of YwqJK toxin-antitoxin module